MWLLLFSVARARWGAGGAAFEIDVGDGSDVGGLQGCLDLRTIADDYDREMI